MFYVVTIGQGSPGVWKKAHVTAIALDCPQ